MSEIDKKPLAKHIACAMLWIIGLPLRIAVTACISVFVIVVLPFSFFMAAYRWSCEDENFDCVLCEGALELYYTFLMKGKWSIFR